MRSDASATDDLNGWQDIAAYLGKSVRTAQRWEALVGLPVHRLTALDGSHFVTARRTDIDAWRAAMASAPSLTVPESDCETGEPDHPTSDPVTPCRAAQADEEARHAPRSALHAGRASMSGQQWLGLMTAVLLAGVGAGAAIAAALMPASLRPVRFVVEGSHVVALTDTYARVWTHRLKSAARRPETVTFTTPEQGDLDGDGIAEIAVAVTYAGPDTTSTESDALLLFGRDGRLWWTIQPGLAEIGLADGRGREGPWRLRSVTFASTPPARVWLAYSHDDPGRNAFVLEVAPDGRHSVRASQAGRISSIVSWHAGSSDFLVIGGTDTDTGQASLTLVSLNPPATGRPASSLASPPLNTSRAAYYLFPASEVGRVRALTPATVMRLRPLGGRLRVEIEDGARPALLAFIDADLRIREVGRSSTYWAVHGTLEAEGSITHPTHACAESREPVVMKSWTPATGWRADSVRLLPNLPGFRVSQSPAQSTSNR